MAMHSAEPITSSGMALSGADMISFSTLPDSSMRWRTRSRLSSANKFVMKNRTNRGRSSFFMQILSTGCRLLGRE